MKRTKIAFLLIPLAVVSLVVGSAFSIFYFGPDFANKENKVNVDITNNNDFGLFNLVTFEDGKYVDEIKETTYKTKLFLDFDSVYFVRSDNLTNRRTFTLSYKGNDNTYFEDKNIGIFVNINIFDSDNRGIKMKSASSSNNAYYPSSSSLVDIIYPSIVTFSNEYHHFSIDKETNTEISYTALIADNIQYSNDEQFFNFAINFDYKEYKTTIDERTFEGNMSPSDYEEIVECDKKIEANKLALDNSVVSLTFYLKQI